MKTIHLSEINEETFYEVLKLEVNENQAQFLAPNVKSLAECYLYRNEDVVPFAILMDSTVVGFAMLDLDAEAKDVTIWRIMIDKNYQNQGFGRQAIECLIQWIKLNTPYRRLYIDYILGNDHAKHFYESMGFVAERINEHGEQVLVLQL